MCYSAQIWADYRKFTKMFGATMSIARFVELFWEKRQDGDWAKLPKAMRAAFSHPRDEQERGLAHLVAEGDRELANALEAEMFAQKTRLAGAERTLASAKPTKKAENDQRIATDKIGKAQRGLADLRRTDLVDRDSRIYPGQYAPVMIEKDGQRIVVPMRYQCRLPGWDAATERKYPGTYNARRDNLEKSWGKLFGHHHGIMVVNRFYENVDRDGKNVVLEFVPDDHEPMLIACLWSFQKGREGEADLFSFAAITDEPPPEVAAAGHDRCIVPIKAEHIDAWLSPDPANLASLYAILDDRARPYYEHRMAA